VYIGIIVRNDGALKAGKKLYISVCGLCIARDISISSGSNEGGVGSSRSKYWLSHKVILITWFYGKI
jgi:hypothetical protein